MVQAATDDRKSLTQTSSHIPLSNLVQYLIKLFMFVTDPVKEPVVAPGGLEDADVWGDAPNVSTLSHEHRPLKERV